MEDIKLLNLNNLLSGAAGGVPLWAWIVIGVVVVVVIVAIVVLIKVARNREKTEAEENASEESGEQPADGSADEDEIADSAGESPAESAPAAEKAEKTEKTEKPQSKPASSQKPAKQEQTAAVQTQSDEPAETKASGPKVYHITKRTSDGKWQVKFNKGKKAIKLFDTQVQAIDYAKALAQSQEASIIIHKADGTFRKLRYDKPNK
mgnify:FL=1